MAEPKQPRRWVEFALEAYPSGAITTYRWATRPLAGSTFIERRVSNDGWEEITRKASSPEGSYAADSASVIIDDSDGLVRALLADVTTQWFKNREGAFKLLSDAAYAVGLTPRILFGGRCHDAQLLDGRKARMQFEDILAPYMTRTYPQYTLGDAYPYRFEGRSEEDTNLDTVDPGVQIPLALRDQVLPIYYGPFVDSAVDPITGLPRQKGMCPTFYMGYTSLSSGGALLTEPTPEMAVILTGQESDWGGWGELFVMLGETDIPNVYTSNLQAQPQRMLNTDDYGITLLAPGHPGWPFPTDYVMRNGFRCTVIYARGPILWHHIIGLVNITVDLCGWKNSAGVSIDQAGFAYQSFLSQHVLANDGDGYTSGPEAVLPTFADGRAMLWTSKVQEWQLLTAARLGTAKGYLTSMPLTSPITLQQILQYWHVTFDAFSAKNSEGQLYPFSIDDLADPEDGVEVRERIELTHLPAPRIDWEQTENSIDYTVGWDPEQGTPRTPTLNEKDDIAIAALKEVRKSPNVRDLRFTSDDATAIDVIGRRLMRLKYPPRYQPLPVRMGGVDREIGEQVLVSHQDGIGAAGTGYAAQPMVTMEHRVRGHHVELLALDVSRILNSWGVIADDSVAADWDAATAEERAEYFFIANDSDVIPSAGEPGTELR